MEINEFTVKQVKREDHKLSISTYTEAVQKIHSGSIQEQKNQLNFAMEELKTVIGHYGFKTHKCIRNIKRFPM